MTTDSQSDYDRCFYERTMPDLSGPIGSKAGTQTFPCHIRRQDHIESSPGGDHPFTPPTGSSEALRAAIVEAFKWFNAEYTVNDWNDAYERGYAVLEAALAAQPEQRCDAARVPCDDPTSVHGDCHQHTHVDSDFEKYGKFPAGGQDA